MGRGDGSSKSKDRGMVRQSSNMSFLNGSILPFSSVAHNTPTADPSNLVQFLAPPYLGHAQNSNGQMMGIPQVNNMNQL